MIKFIFKYIQKRITKTKFISYIQKELYDKISDLHNFINICFGFLKIWTSIVGNIVVITFADKLELILQFNN